MEIRPHCVDVSENLTEKFVKIFQKSTPSVQRFAERKFQIIMEEQDRDLEVSFVLYLLIYQVHFKSLHIKVVIPEDIYSVFLDHKEKIFVTNSIECSAKF